METMDTTAFEQQILKLGLVSEHQLAEIHDEIGDNPDLGHLISLLERKSYMTPWQRGKVLKGDFDGFFLGGYRLLYKIASGSFGRVFRADDPRDGRVVAVKVLRRRWSEDQRRIDLFIREGKVGLSLKHPNIVEVLAINRDSSSGQYYLVMEFVEGGNLREILQIRKKLNVAESLRIVEDCANGLTYAYARGMTHRDIKLTNLLISSQGECKLVDFGLAEFFASFSKEEEKVDRTVDYAGLERATGVKTGDVRSDIYFLGVVLYEALTGRPPILMTRDRHARMRKERFEHVQPINPDEIDGPPSVLALVETMMSLDPRQRYQTPSQMLDAVRSLRREVDGKSGRDGVRRSARSVFLAEADEHLQDVLRDGLKDKGYRVFLAGDPARALDRFHQQPYDGLIVDANTTGEDGLIIFGHIIEEAARKHLPCAAILLLGQDQATWEARVPKVPHSAVMIHPITFKPLVRKLKELMESAHGPEPVGPSALEDHKPKSGRRPLDEQPDEEAVEGRRGKGAGDVDREIEDLLGEDDAPQPHRGVPAWQAHGSSMKPVPHEHSRAAFPPPDPQGLRDQIGPTLLQGGKDKAGGEGSFWSRLDPKQKGGIIALGIVTLALCCYFLFGGKVSESNFEKIEPGMTVDEVESILGTGEELSTAASTSVKDPNVKPAKTMKWKSGGLEIHVVFMEGKVSVKHIFSR
jgi:CheY-like chemotaxis protein